MFSVQFGIPCVNTKLGESLCSSGVPAHPTLTYYHRENVNMDIFTFGVFWLPFDIDLQSSKINGPVARLWLVWKPFVFTKSTQIKLTYLCNWNWFGQANKTWYRKQRLITFGLESVSSQLNCSLPVKQAEYLKCRTTVSLQIRTKKP